MNDKELTEFSILLHNTIKRISDEEKDPFLALSKLNSIREEIHRAEVLADSRSNLMLLKVGVPEDGELPKWAHDQLEYLQDNPNILPTTINRTKRIFKAANAILKDNKEISAYIEILRPGVLCAEWVGTPSTIWWVIKESCSPWPGIKVTWLSPKPSNPFALDQKHFYDAICLMNEFRNLMKAAQND